MAKEQPTPLLLGEGELRRGKELVACLGEINLQGAAGDEVWVGRWRRPSAGGLTSLPVGEVLQLETISYRLRVSLDEVNESFEPDILLCGRVLGNLGSPTTILLR